MSSATNAPKERNLDTSGSPRSKPQERPTNLLQMKLGRFGLSNASTVKPESSQVSAEGKIQGPNSATPPVQDLESPQNADTTGKAPQMINSENGTSGTGNHQEESGVASAKKPASDKEAVSSNSVATEGQGDSAPTQNMDSAHDEASATAMPDAQVFSPSISKLATEAKSPFLRSVNQSHSSMPVPSAPQVSPILSGPNAGIEKSTQILSEISQNAEKVPNLVAVAKLPEMSTIGIVNLDTPELPIAPLGKPSLKGRIVGVVRRTVLRRHVLKFLLGRQLGEVTHGQLSGAQQVTEKVGLPSGLGI